MSALKTSSTATTITWDHNAIAPLSEVWDRISQLAAESPIVWNTSYGGFWMLAGYEECFAAYEDWNTFSSLHDGVEGDPFAKRDVGHYPEGRTPRAGVSIPEQPARFVPTECDPPMHTAIRRLEAPFFTPKAVRTYEAGIREHTIEAIEAVRASGRIDFVADFTSVVPAMMTAELIGLGKDKWKGLSDTVHKLSIYPASSPEFPLDLFLSTQAQILDLVKRRQAEPADDVASALITGSILGTPIEPAEAQTILNGLTFASTDTTATTLQNTLRYLSAHPETREQLREHPELIKQAVEEFLRLFTPGLGAVRTVATETEFYGHRFSEGDRVMLLMSAGNRDPRKFPDPLTIDISRSNAGDHMAFGFGVHKCLGAPVARLELRIMLEELLARIPDFTIIDSEVIEYPRKGGVFGYDVLPATFTPAADRVAVDA